MKRLLILFMVIASISAKCDTIDYWHVYYNQNLVGDFSFIRPTLGYTNLVKLKASQIRPGDMLRIEYFGDIISWNCPFQIMPVGNDSAILFKGIDSSGRVMCPASDELAIKVNDVRRIFIMSGRDSSEYKIELFSLRVE